MACVVAGLWTHAEIVTLLRTRAPQIYRELGNPRLIGYDWVAWPKNRDYSEWLHRQAASGEVGEFSHLSRRLSRIKGAYYVSTILLVLIVLFWSWNT